MQFKFLLFRVDMWSKTFLLLRSSRLEVFCEKDRKPATLLRGSRTDVFL